MFLVSNILSKEVEWGAQAGNTGDLFFWAQYTQNKFLAAPPGLKSVYNVRCTTEDNVVTTIDPADVAKSL